MPGVADSAQSLAGAGVAEVADAAADGGGGAAGGAAPILPPA